ncbi:hypothetical protein BDV93DRAFT_562686 [Ceratobasidium sp. AG-I]|nr:hypothetical protein BDV93DRAFT_562686 [Ceratobasidium sp. AG-I]
MLSLVPNLVDLELAILMDLIHDIFKPSLDHSFSLIQFAVRHVATLGVQNFLKRQKCIEDSTFTHTTSPGPQLDRSLVDVSPEMDPTALPLLKHIYFPQILQIMDDTLSLASVPLTRLGVGLTVWGQGFELDAGWHCRRSEAFVRRWSMLPPSTIAESWAALQQYKDCHLTLEKFIIQMEVGVAPRIPLELILHIADYSAQLELFSLVTLNRDCHRTLLPILYRNINLTHTKSTFCFCDAIINNGLLLGSCPRSIHIEFSRISIDDLKSLGQPIRRMLSLTPNLDNLSLIIPMYILNDIFESNLDHSFSLTRFAVRLASSLGLHDFLKRQEHIEDLTVMHAAASDTRLDRQLSHTNTWL